MKLQSAIVVGVLFFTFQPNDVTAADSDELARKIDSLQETVDAIWERVKRFIGVAIPEAPARFRLVQDNQTWADAEGICKKAGGHLATFNGVNQWKSVVTPLFDLKTKEGWEPQASVAVGGKGLGTGGMNSWSGIGFGYDDGFPFPFNFGNESTPWELGKTPWIEKNHTFDDDTTCLTISFNVSTSWYTPSAWLHTLTTKRCSDKSWFLCEI